MLRKGLCLALVSTASLLLVPGLASGGDPGGTRMLLHNDQRVFALPAFAQNGQGDLLLAWHFSGVGVFAQRFTAAGSPVGPRYRLDGPEAEARGRLAVASDGDRFFVVWDNITNHAGTYSYAQAVDRNGPGPRPNGTFGNGSVGGVAVGAAGTRLAILWRGAVFVQRLSPQGRPTGHQLQVAAAGFFPRLAATSNGFVATWLAGQDHVLQRLDAQGRPTGQPRRVSRLGSVPAGLAANGRDRVALAWFERDQLFAQIFDEEGRARSGKLLVAASIPGLNVTLALDRAGKLVVSWEQLVTGGRRQVFARRFEASGEPAGRAFPATETASFATQPALSPAPDGSFLWVWAAVGFGDSELLARRLGWARAGDAACVVRAGSFLCDVARDGGDEERRISFGTAGDVALLGDLDGDGRDDPCVARGTRLLCDTAHDGGAAEVDLAFSLGLLPGDVPLLGDVDGEGRDDFCLLRGAQLHCDTAHNGGTAEVVVPTAASVQPALLGDLDGDGADELCRVGGGALSCDTGHDGGRAEVVIPLLLAEGEVALLGDMDRDGDDDPCVYRAGRFLCDTAHLGGAPGVVVRFGGASGDQPLLGDLEGL